MKHRSILFVVESGTDCRLVDGFAGLASLTVLARKITGGREISQPPEQKMDIRIGPASRLKFALWVVRQLRHWPGETLLISQGYGVTSTVINLLKWFHGRKAILLICSPSEVYYACRKRNRHTQTPYSRLFQWGYELCARINALLAWKYIALSDYLKEVLLSHGTQAPITVIPLYGVDLQVFRPLGIDPTILRRKLDLPEKGQLLFFSSRVAPEKDAYTVLEATRQVRAELPELRIINCSGGFQEFEELARSLGIEGMVIARPAVDPRLELVEYYNASDVCIQASIAEGLGFSPLEALACGCPVIASQVGGLTETIIDGKTGRSYAPQDVASLAQCIRQFFANPIEERRKCAQGQAMIREKYSRELVFNRFWQEFGDYEGL